MKKPGNMTKAGAKQAAENKAPKVPNPYEKPLNFKPSEFHAAAQAYSRSMKSETDGEPAQGPASMGPHLSIDEIENRVRMVIRSIANDDAENRQRFGERFYPEMKSPDEWTRILYAALKYGL